MNEPTIHVIAVAYHKFGELKVFVQSWLNQTNKNWLLTVIHDGSSEDFDSIMSEYKKIDPLRIEYFCTENRYNDYGHTLRDIGIESARGDYVLLTNADNYFIPKAVEFLVEAANNNDVVIYDMIHSHNNPGVTQLPSYSHFIVKYARNYIDVSSAIVKTDLAKRVGFRDKSFSGDATYFEDIRSLQNELKITKIPRVLFVHN